MAIKLSGVVSGIDTDAVIQQLLEIDARAKTKLEEKKKTIEDDKGVFADFETKLTSVKAEADKLMLSSVFQKRSVTSTDTSVATSTVADGATPGTYALLIDRLATQTTNKSTAEINTNKSERSSQSVSPGTSPIDLTKTFANAGFHSSLVTGSTVTFTTDSGVFTSAMLSTYGSVQEFIDAANADADAGINVWYDSTNDRFNFERKNNTAGTLNLAQSDANGLFTYTYVSTGAVAGNETGLNPNAKLKDLNTGTAIGTGAGSFKINNVSISYDTSSDSLQNLIDRVNNSSATTGVTAFYDQTLDRVVMTRTVEGPQTIDLDATSDAQSVLTRLNLSDAGTSLGTTALFSINGNSITSDSNTYAFSGITLNLKKQGDADGTIESTDASASVNVTQDTASVATSIKALVTAYNDFADFLEENASYNADTETAGKLFGDSLVNSIEARLKRILFQQQSGLTSTHQLLAQLGIQLGDFQTPDANRLVVDDTDLTNAIASNAPAVEQLFGRSTTGSSSIKNDGIAYDLSTYINELTKFQGLVDLKDQFFDDQIEDIDERMVKEDARLERLEASLRRQFTAMEGALALINAQGSSLSQQLSKL